MTRAQQVAVTVTCLVATLTYAGAVTTYAMGLFVLPGVAGAAVLASILAARRLPVMAIAVVGALVLGWAELVNIWTGTANGPAARSTAFAAGATLITVVLAHSRWPALFLGGVAGVVVGALVLGAAGEVRIVVVVTAVCAALTLGWIEQSRRNWTAPPRRSVALVLLSLLAGAAAVGAVLLQAQKDTRQPALLTQGRDYPGIKPAWTDPLATASDSLRRRAVHNRPASRPARPHTATSSHSAPARNHARSIWLYVAAAIVLLVLVLLLALVTRLAYARLAWWRARRRLAAGARADQVIGAWAWTRMRLEAYRLPLAVNVSPDVVVAGRAVGDLPTGVSTPLRWLAAATTKAAFSGDRRSLSAGEVAAAWRAAGKADESARTSLTRGARARVAFRSPASTARSH